MVQGIHHMQRTPWAHSRHSCSGFFWILASTDSNVVFGPPNRNCPEQEADRSPLQGQVLVLVGRGVPLSSVLAWSCCFFRANTFKLATFWLVGFPQPTLSKYLCNIMCEVCIASKTIRPDLSSRTSSRMCRLFLLSVGSLHESRKHAG